MPNRWRKSQAALCEL